MSADTIAAAPKNPILPARTTGAPLAFIPRDFDDAWRQATLLSQVGIFPDYLKGKPHDILCTIVTGAELGLSPMQSVRDIVVVKGKGFIQSKLKVALVKQALNVAAGEYFRLVESTAQRAIYETKREGEGVTRYEYTMEMAKTAGLAGQDNYQKRPAEMLRARCSGDLADIVWSDVVRGIGNKEDLPEAQAIALNNAPATFAPPPPPIEDAQTVPPTPPPPPNLKQAFDQAKNELELKGIPPVEQPKKRSVYEDKTSDAPREPGSDDGEEFVDKPGSMNPDDILKEVEAVNIADPKGVEQLDLISPRAKRVEGPKRQQIADAMKAKREAIKKGGK